jgi:hypothetical protein
MGGKSSTLRNNANTTPFEVPFVPLRSPQNEKTPPNIGFRAKPNARHAILKSTLLNARALAARQQKAVLSNAEREKAAILPGPATLARQTTLPGIAFTRPRAKVAIGGKRKTARKTRKTRRS